MKLTLEDAKLLYEDVKKNGVVKSQKTKITRTLETEIIVADNWEYTFYYHKGVMVKIEEYNHRELIEVNVI